MILAQQELSPAVMGEKVCSSIVCSLIYLRCFLKVPDESIRFLMNRHIVPPQGMRKRDLAIWIDGAISGYFRAPTATFETRRAVEATKVWVGPDSTTATLVTHHRLTATKECG